MLYVLDEIAVLLNNGFWWVEQSHGFIPTLPSPSEGEGVKKSIWLFFTSFRRNPESRSFTNLQILWTPVFTGVTAEIQYFHTFGEG
jgi:hypothetical protein